MRLHAAPLLDKPVDRITSADVLGCLAAIWTSKPAAAKKARHRIAAVFRWCIGKNLRPDNPVDRAVVALQRANGNAPRHYRGGSARGGRGGAWGDPPGEIHPPFGGALRRDDRVDGGSGRRGARGAVRRDRQGGGAVDDPGIEDESRARVLCPLSTGALDVLDSARALSPESSLVFPSKTGGLLPRNAPGRLLLRAGVDSTVHGFRSSARSLDGRIRSPCGGRGGLPRGGGGAAGAGRPASRTALELVGHRRFGGC